MAKKKSMEPKVVSMLLAIIADFYYPNGKDFLYQFDPFFNPFDG